MMMKMEVMHQCLHHQRCVPTHFPEPKGWTFNEPTGYFQLTDKINDFWEVKAGCLLRHHATPRHSTVDISKFSDIPIDLQYLDPVRITVMKSPDGSVNILNDDGTQQKSISTCLDWPLDLPDQWCCSSRALQVLQPVCKETWT